MKEISDYYRDRAVYLAKRNLDEGTIAQIAQVERVIERDKYRKKEAIWALPKGMTKTDYLKALEDKRKRLLDKVGDWSIHDGEFEAAVAHELRLMFFSGAAIAEAVSDLKALE